MLIHQRFAERGRERPDAIALRLGDSALSYGELEARAERIAATLAAAGVAPGSLVALGLPVSFDLIAAMLGVLKAGCAYLPLGADWPRERALHVLADAQASCVLSTEEEQADWQSTGVLVLTTSQHAPPLPAHDRPLPSANSVAYVIYTSGSTGRPKGVQVSHANVLRLFDATAAWFAFDGRDVWTLLHSAAFDFSVWEIWGALLHGGCLVLVPRTVIRTPGEVLRLVESQAVTVLNQTPSAFRQLLLERERRPSAPLKLRFVILGGEALDPRSVRSWFDGLAPAGCALINMYGITETTVHASYRPITAADTRGAASPIGVALPDMTLHLLDAQLQPSAVDEVGELYLSGAGVALGYLNRPDLTSQRFVQLPGIGRAYRSGDLAVRRADGELEFVGRADQQVKIRGFRIELGEIEAALRDVGVADAAVTVREDQRGEKHLVAHVVPGARFAELELSTRKDAAARAFIRQLREQLARRLPNHMLPARFELHARLPLTSNGKLDRARLHELPPGRDQPVDESECSPVEGALAELYKEILELEHVAPEDDFFELGGSSLSAVVLLARLNADRELISPADFFSHSRLRDLAAHLEQATQTEEQTRANCSESV